MANAHQWLFEPARPLVDRLGPEFFRQIPACPGVYCMHNTAGAVIYVGKAKDLRRRLGCYRVANPERISRRHLRLMREVVRIEFIPCRSESVALACEARLLRCLKPRYNRAGVWPGKPRFLTWRFTGHVARFSVDEVPPFGWNRFGPAGRSVLQLSGAVLRLIWLVLHPEAGSSQIPHGWARTRFPFPVALGCGDRTEEIRSAMDQLFWGDGQEFLRWVVASLVLKRSSFEQVMVQADLDEVETFLAGQRGGRKPSDAQLVLL
jgi:hypothetical protein